MSAGPVVIVGGGPAGLAAALALRRRDVPDVLVLERETAPGGIPRHAQHQGFGLRDLRRPLSGPSYARRYSELAAAAGVELRTETMVTGWVPGGPLELTGPRGREQLEPAAVVLATGCRERPRSARLVPGSRPEGVMTTGTLQQLVYLKGLVARPARARGRRRACELLRTAHAGARRSASGGDGHGAAATSVARTVPSRRRPALPDAALDADRGDGDPRAPARGGGGAHAISTAGLCAACRATRSSSAPTGSPTTSSPLWLGSRWTRARAGRGWTPLCARRAQAYSLPATSCTAPRPPTWLRSAAATRPPRPPRSWPRVAPGRRSAWRWSARHRCTGSRRTWWCRSRSATAGALRASLDQLPAAPARGDRAGRPRALVRPPGVVRARPLGRVAARMDGGCGPGGWAGERAGGRARVRAVHGA